jgi:uncharacterized protein YprB with RNaseH-like and TPR domain
LLRKTFIHLQGIGEQAERLLWKQGCVDWDCYLDAPSAYSVGSASREVVRKGIATSKKHLADGNHQYFAKRLKARHAWRAFGEFRDRCVCLDIETDGSPDADGVTCIGLYDGKDYVCLLKGEDLESFRDRISYYSMIVTFFGTGFDLPVLLKRFPGLILDQIHFDLCPALKHLGFRGGLKKIEAAFDIERNPETVGLNGFDAVKLWRSYARGNDSALNLFVKYNREDTVNLMKLAEVSVCRLEEATGFPKTRQATLF